MSFFNRRSYTTELSPKSIRQLGESHELEKDVASIRLAIDEATGIRKSDRLENIDFTLKHGYLLVSGGLKKNDSAGRYAEIPVKSGEKYTLSTKIGYWCAGYAFYDDDGNMVDWYPRSNSAIDVQTLTITVVVPANAKLLIVSCTVVDSPYYIKKHIPNGSFEVVPYGNVLYGKKWAACGDSFTAGDFKDYVDANGNSGFNSDAFDQELKVWRTYPWFIGKRNNMDIVWLAAGGNDLTNISGAVRPFSDPNTEQYNYTKIPSDCDYVTLMFGLNETNLTDEQIGNHGDATNETLWGAYHVILTSILTNNPFCKIGIIIADAWMNQKYHDAVINIAKRYGVPYLDLKDGVDVPVGIQGRFVTNAEVRNLRTNAFRISETNTHPNVKAHEYRSTIIENFLRSL